MTEENEGNERENIDTEETARQIANASRTYYAHPDKTAFEDIRKRINEACKAIIKTGKYTEVNILDCQCTRVVFCRNKDGSHFWLIDIEEAGPEEYGFKAEVGNMMREQCINVEINLEW